MLCLTFGKLYLIIIYTIFKNGKSKVNNIYKKIASINYGDVCGDVRTTCGDVRTTCGDVRTTCADVHTTCANVHGT